MCELVTGKPQILKETVAWKVVGSDGSGPCYKTFFGSSGWAKKVSPMSECSYYGILSIGIDYTRRGYHVFCTREGARSYRDGIWGDDHRKTLRIKKVLIRGKAIPFVHPHKHKGYAVAEFKL